MGSGAGGRKADQIDEETFKVLARIDEEADARDCYKAIKQRIDAIEAAGQLVPEALIIAQRQLMTDLVAQSQGR
jgi:hypothetical protein